jgi:hypothetical protein
MVQGEDAPRPLSCENNVPLRDGTGCAGLSSQLQSWSLPPHRVVDCLPHRLDIYGSAAHRPRDVCAPRLVARLPARPREASPSWARKSAQSSEQIPRCGLSRKGEGLRAEGNGVASKQPDGTCSRHVRSIARVSVRLTSGTRGRRAVLPTSVELRITLNGGAGTQRRRRRLSALGSPTRFQRSRSTRAALHAPTSPASIPKGTAHRKANPTLPSYSCVV